MLDSNFHVIDFSLIICACSGVVMAAVFASGPGEEELLPRPKRRRHRARADRGLPPDEELARLAEAYLKRGRKLWPDLATGGILPSPTKSVIHDMVEDFKTRHRTGEVASQILSDCHAARLKLGGIYARFSCDNSDPTSIIDQVTNCLEKAKQTGRFCPWSCVFGDYSISGLDSARQGYSSYKKTLRKELCRIEATFIDDFTRASRDEIEWWKLASLSKKLGLELIGASDGFNMSDEDWDMKITMYGLVSRLFLKGLRQKVRRGMRGAAERGTNLGKLPLGFTRRPLLDDAGHPVSRRNGKPRTVPCVDPTTREDVVRLFDLFVEHKWTPYRIARDFNDRRVDDWNGWTESTVKKLLRNSAFIGIFVWDKFRSEFDYEKEQWARVKNPRPQWKVNHDPGLAIIDLKMWRGAQRRLSEMRRKSPLTGRPPTRNEISATTLFSGTLFCGYCGRELLLHRSAGKYKSMGCLNGATRAHDCKLATSKSTRIIERCLLDFIREHLVTEDVIASLVAKANEHLAEQAAQPKSDTAPLKSQIKALQAKIDKLVRRVEETDNDALCEGYHRRITQHQRQVISFREQLRDEQSLGADVPPPLDVARVQAYLKDLSDVLNQSIPESADAIRALTGRIEIRQEEIPGRSRGARWIASFSPNLVALLGKVAQDKDYPDSVTLEFLRSGIWITPVDAECVIHEKTLSEKIATQAAELARTHSHVTCAAILGVNLETLKNAIKVAEGHEPRKRSNKKRRSSTGSEKRTTFHDIADDVAIRRDKNGESFDAISRELGVSSAMVRRAYDAAHPELMEAAAATGEPPRRAKNSRLGQAKKDQISEMIGMGARTCDIVAAVGCSRTTVARMRQRLRA